MQPEASGAPISVVGHCITGAMAPCTAAAVGAAASFHGGRLLTDSDGSPHHVLPRVKARLYSAHAERDRSMPSEALRQLERALSDWGGQYESEVYPGALHGWTSSDSPVYHQTLAERAFGRLLEFLPS